MKIVFRNERQRAQAFLKAAEASADVSADKPYALTVERLKRDRSGAQNRLSFMWYSQMADQRDMDKEGERNECKWDLGFPILMARENPDPAIVKMYEILSQRPHYDACSAMPIVEVTSLFTVKEFTEYLRAISMRAYHRGLTLTHPEDIYREAMGERR